MASPIRDKRGQKDLGSIQHTNTREAHDRGQLRTEDVTMIGGDGIHGGIQCTAFMMT